MYILCQDAADEAALRARIASTGRTGSNFKYLQIATDSFWTRDFGPMFIRFKDSGRQAEGIVDFAYYWGSNPLDDAFPANLANAWSMKNFPVDLYFEGGNFMTDGAGTYFTSTWLIFGITTCVQPHSNRGKDEGVPRLREAHPGRTAEL